MSILLTFLNNSLNSLILLTLGTSFRPGSGLMTLPFGSFPGSGLMTLPFGSFPGSGLMTLPFGSFPGSGLMTLPFGSFPGNGLITFPFGSLPGNGLTTFPFGSLPGSGLTTFPFGSLPGSGRVDSRFGSFFPRSTFGLSWGDLPVPNFGRVTFVFGSELMRPDAFGLGANFDCEGNEGLVKTGDFRAFRVLGRLALRDGLDFFGSTTF